MNEKLKPLDIVDDRPKVWFWCMRCEKLFRAALEDFGTVEGEGEHQIHKMPAIPLDCPGVATGECDANYLDVLPATNSPDMPRPHWPPVEGWHEGDLLFYDAEDDDE